MINYSLVSFDIISHSIILNYGKENNDIVLFVNFCLKHRRVDFHHFTNQLHTIHEKEMQISRNLPKEDNVFYQLSMLIEGRKKLYKID